MAAAIEDPVRFVCRDYLMLIDEVQRILDVWLAIKSLLDRKPKKPIARRTRGTGLASP